MTRIYIGFIDDNDVRHVQVVENHEDARELDPRLDLYNHSPSGFAWGYGGSGPAQCALAVLADFFKDDEAALRLHQRFKRACIARLDRVGGWTLTREDILDALLDEEPGGDAP